ncbi:2-hydroxychromene-2-carboxylate isomerase [Paraburkholderia fungorum]|uniref:2-hydroxychromene-2-carboxylate isomerase n=1 Tax=Paraburkholderia fungorum TaxID=134537 RepID=A0A1H0ZVL4_9BURK|nr:2-hydroxychromene-2-carboxylate isomerase [Paraburkholderia fungorum]SDQ31086.1 2-hydroxychromene-2-carboxylate isomerase [Paraburkholderia fungorum]
MTVGIDATQPLWFYDFVSPFTYLLLEQHDKWPGFDYAFTPVVLNDLYKHWGQQPAYSVPAKRIFMYRHALFRAEQLGIPYKMPPSHPFDSMKPLLLATAAANNDIQFVREIFRFIWREGRDPSSDAAFAELCERVGVADGPDLIKSEAVKAQLQRNTTDAIGLGVYGVPTFRLNEQLFWGEDALPMVLYCARTPNWLESREVKRVSSLPPGSLEPTT